MYAHHRVTTELLCLCHGYSSDTTTTEQRLYRGPISWFSYDFGVTVIRHHNVDAMVLPNSLMSSDGRYRVLGIRYHKQRYRYRLLTWYRSILAPFFNRLV